MAARQLTEERWHEHADHILEINTLLSELEGLEFFKEVEATDARFKLLADLHMGEIRKRVDAAVAFVCEAETPASAGRADAIPEQEPGIMKGIRYSRRDISPTALAERAKSLKNHQVDAIICCADGLRCFGNKLIEENSEYGGGVFALGDQVGKTIEDISRLLDDLREFVYPEGEPEHE